MIHPYKLIIAHNKFINLYKLIIIISCTLVLNVVVKIDPAFSRNLEEYNRGEPCSINIYVKNSGSMHLKGRLHEYPRSGFCCIAQPLTLSYKNSKVDEFMNEAVKAAENNNYNLAILNILMSLHIKKIPDARRALLAAYGARDGATITQSGEMGGCSLVWGQWIWIRITGTLDTFGRF